MISNRSRRIVIGAACLSLFLSLAGTTNLVPTVEAASSSASARIIKKLKKQIKSLKLQVSRLNQELSTALQPSTSAPFVEMVTVGDAGNSADPEDGDILTSGIQNFGAVPYEFQIGMTEVTNAQYVVFLNAVAATDAFALYNPLMGSHIQGGIARFGSSPDFIYAVRSAMGDKPVNFVSWFDAARFCNWLHNGRPKGAQDANTTENGAYALNGATSGVGFARQAGAMFWIPSEDEWYKAAYHDPREASADGPAGDDHYWLYPTKSDEIPTVATTNGIGEITNDGGNLANYNVGADWNGQDGNVTTVGSGGPGSASFYGAFDMGGNVHEWNDAVISGTFRCLRGGGWPYDESILRSSRRLDPTPFTESTDVGFRVASP